MALETAPPKESIGGTKRRQIVAMERGISSYAYLEELDEIKNSYEYDEMDTDEKELFDADFDAEITAYEKNQARVNLY